PPKDVSGLRTELRNLMDVNPFPTLPPYSLHLTLDPNTAHRWLSLSRGNEKATFSRAQSHVHHPDRFVEKPQVLSRANLTGRCYWEVEQRPPRATVAVSYKDISRTGPESEFGYNNASWVLKFSSECTFIHNSITTSISGPPFSKIGVYLDHSAGILSFYRVSDTMTLIHRVQTTFTQPLYAGFRVYDVIKEPKS
uniref:B30.2/SPRY domain-containing protein n=1 Tax=Acanthochromis polyacanthus TaxID=80966 RepID=A0A3Q1FS70_9TELE